MESLLHSIRREMAKVVVGQQDFVDQLLLSVVCQSHSQIEGTPGVGKWLTVNSLARCLGVTAGKIRCSPDLSPEDIIEGWDQPVDRNIANDVAGSRSAPFFANLVLVEHIARLSPRVGNLMQQAIQERAIVVRGQRRDMPRPFSLFATRSPAGEHDEAPDLFADRFLFRIAVSCPPYDQEYGMARAVTGLPVGLPQPVLSSDQLTALLEQVPAVDVPASVLHYAVRLVRATRVHEGENPDFVYEWVEQGAGPRAVQGLILSAKAYALLNSRSEVRHADVRAVSLPTLRHRVLANRNARSNGITADRIIQRLLDEIPSRVRGDDASPRPGASFTLHDWMPVDPEDGDLEGRSEHMP